MWQWDSVGAGFEYTAISIVWAFCKKKLSEVSSEQMNEWKTSVSVKISFHIQVNQIQVAAHNFLRQESGFAVHNPFKEFLELSKQL